MTEHEFETFLAGAYRAPSDRPERPQIAVAVLARVERRRRSRTAILGLAAVAGVGVAGAAFAVTGLGDVMMRLAAHASAEPAMIDPSIVVAIGLVLMLAVA